MAMPSLMGMQPPFGAPPLHPGGIAGYVQPNQIPAPLAVYPPLDSASASQPPFAMSMYPMAYLVNQRNNQNPAFIEENSDPAMFPQIALQEAIQRPIQYENLPRLLPPQPQEVEAVLPSVEGLASSKENEEKPESSVVIVD